MAPADDQSACLAFLSDPAHLGQPGPVVRIDTHISAIFLAGDRAFKLKRAVSLPFLDFSRLEQREKACRAELAVNRRSAPELYLGLKAVTRESNGRLCFDGKGEVLDWVVEMRRFEQDAQYDRLAASLTRDDANDLADTVADFHRAAEPRPAWGGVQGLRHTIATNAACFDLDTPGLFPEGTGVRLTADSSAWLNRLAPLLEKRRKNGSVRLCHGDLHLANICRFQGKPTLFDAIEFNDDFACIDVLYDLAFLLMDLQAKGFGQLASWVLNRYVERRDEAEGLAALPLFLSLRAAIRAHVSAAMARGTGRDASLRVLALDYMARAAAYLQPLPPRLLAVGGLSGSGKSRLARDLAPLLGLPIGAVVLRTDVIRKQLMGVDPETRLPPAGYSPEMSIRTYQTLFDKSRALLAAGLTVVADAVFAKEEQRLGIENAARQAGVPFEGIWLNASAEAMRRRIAGRTKNASDATVGVLNAQLDMPLGNIVWLRLDSSGTKEETFANAKRRIKSLNAAC
ncbi:MAG TPA: AAA family ATPase [Candidatus Sulfotelmatobacter sp.]|jgi:aminoglycoside phosphotransferase family enzyme/predicted kinase|nr:AAA family ATPase [Candidatus Sulfotelmatobacter sp.]